MISTLFTFNGMEMSIVTFQEGSMTKSIIQNGYGEGVDREFDPGGPDPGELEGFMIKEILNENAYSSNKKSIIC